MIAITETGDGLILPVRAQPGAKRNAVVGEHNGALKVAVTAPAQDGRANEALVEVLSKALGVKRSQVCLLSGATGREKRFVVRGVAFAELTQKVQAFLPG